MKESEIEYKLNQLIDNELDDRGQEEVFELLATDSGARKIYFELLSLNKKLVNHYSSTNIELAPISIKQAHPPKQNYNFYKIGFVISSAAALILAMLLMWGKSSGALEQESYLSSNIAKNIEEPVQNISPVKTEKKSDVKKPHTFYSKTQSSRSIAVSERKPVDIPDSLKQMIRRYREVSVANSVTISKEDFIGGQIVAN